MQLNNFIMEINMNKRTLLMSVFGALGLSVPVMVAETKRQPTLMFILKPTSFEGGNPSNEWKKDLLSQFGIDYDKEMPGWQFTIDKRVIYNN